MADPARKYRPEIEPNIRPRLGVIQGRGESTPSRANLSEAEASNAQDLQDREQNFGVIDGGGQSTPERANLQSASDNINAAKTKEAGWKDNYRPSSGSKQTSSGKLKFLKQKGPLGFIGGGLGVAGIYLSLLTSPGLILMQIKNILFDFFSDELSSMTVQDKVIMKKKFSGTTKGLCTKVVTIRCKMNTMSDKQLKKLEAAGVKVNTTGDTTLIKGRHKVVNFEFEGKKISAPNFNSSLLSDAKFRGAMRRAYSPKLAIRADALFSKLSAKLGISKLKNITGADEKARRKSLLDAANGQKVAEQTAKVTSTEEDCSSGPDCKDGKRTVYRDATTGEIIDKDTYESRLSSINEEFRTRRALSDTGGKIAKGTLKGALTVTAMGLGAVDSACTGYQLIRAVGFAAKYLGALQLLRFSHTIMNTTDTITALEADPEAIEYVGKILTSTNSQGMSATDSYGYKYAAYGDVNPMPRPEDSTAESVGSKGNNVKLSDKEKEKVLIADETTKYINGQLVSKGLLAKLTKVVGNNSSSDELDDSCKFVKSGWGQTIVIGTAVVGAVVAFFTGGLSLGWGTVAQIAVSVAISVAIAMLTPKLIDMASGTLIGDDELTNGNRAGNALTSGMGSYNDQASQARGVPALKEEDAVAAKQFTNQTLAQYAEEDRLEHGPLDASNPNTFMGSLVQKLVPYSSKLSSVTGGMSALTGITAMSFATLMPSVNAADPSAEYKVCQDMDYKELGLAVDPFCNVRHGFKKQTAEMDPDKYIDYMIYDNKYADEVTGKPTSDDNDYAKYIKDCMDRSVSIGGYSEENPDKGEKCIQGAHSGAEEEKYNMFRMFYMGMSIDDGQENGYAQPATTAQSTTPTGVTGDARALALQVANNPNIILRDTTKAQLTKFGNGGQVFDSCGKPMTVSKHLLGALLTNATKYKINVNNIGFREDRNRCEGGTYQHPKGTAVDLNRIEVIGGGSTGADINLPGSDVAIVTQYANDFLLALPRNRGGVGQKDHGIHPTFPPGSVALNGTHSFSDAGDHLHIDARNRQNLLDTE